MENIEKRNVKIPNRINNKSYVKYITHKKSKKEWQKFYMSGKCLVFFCRFSITTTSFVLRCESIYIGDLFPNSMTQILTDPYVCPVTSISRGRIAKSSELVFYLVALGSLGEPQGDMPGEPQGDIMGDTRRGDWSGDMFSMSQTSRSCSLAALETPQEYERL